MTTKLTLYFTGASPPARAVLLLAKYLDVDLEVKEVDEMGGEHKGEEYTKLNPVQKIPVLVDGDFVLTESRAIMAYLVHSKKPGSELYPSEPKMRARIDERLYYDATIVFNALAGIAVLK